MQKLTGFEKLTAPELEAFIAKNAAKAEAMSKIGVSGISNMVADARAELARKQVMLGGF